MSHQTIRTWVKSSHEYLNMECPRASSFFLPPDTDPDPDNEMCNSGIMAQLHYSGS